LVVTAHAPASTSNLGPGFDCLGAALNLGLRVTLSDAPASGDNSLVERAVELVTGHPVEGSIVVSSDIPVARGLGSSGACVAAGLVLGCALAGREPDRAALLAVGTPLEGHPDNLAAALFGGLVVALRGDGVVRLDPEPSVRPLILLPRERLATAEARGVLPAEVTLGDAVSNIAGTAGLVAVLTGAAKPSRELLLQCTRDALHQPYRAPLMPKTADALRSLRDRGIAAAVSGAGPSIVCLVVRSEEDFVREAAGSLEGWELVELEWDTQGAYVMEE